MAFWQKFGRKRYEDAAHGLYSALVVQARAPAFYALGGVPDSVDGRFDMIALHTFLVVRRLSGADATPDEAGLSQALFDLMFADMDRNLREMGVGDLGVGKKIRVMVSAFYGRAKAYEDGLAASVSDVPDLLVDALRRNLYRGTPPSEWQIEQVASYMRNVVDRLAAQDSAALLRGEVIFCAAPSFDATETANG